MSRRQTVLLTAEPALPDAILAALAMSSNGILHALEELGTLPRSGEKSAAPEGGNGGAPCNGDTCEARERCTGQPPRELSLRLADLRGNFDEALDQVIHEERPVVLYSASRTDPFGIEDDPPQAGRPLAILLPIGEYRELVRCAEERGQLLRNIADAAHRATA